MAKTHHRFSGGMLRRIDNPAFFFDFDGTLAEIVPTPEEAGLKPAARTVIEELKRRFPVCIISGRRLSDLKKLVGIRGIFYSGNHGVEIEGPGLRFVEPESAKSSRYITGLISRIEEDLRRIHPRINSKKYSASIHYRGMDRRDAATLLAEVDRLLAKPLGEKKIDVFHGKKVVEIKPPVDWGKGDAIEMIMRKAVGKGVPVFFGDDTTDEHGFREVNKLGGVSVFVGSGSRKTLAKHRVSNPGALIEAQREFLALPVNSGG